MPRILNFGSLNIDHVYRVHDFVRPGETIDSLDYNHFAGGKGLNQSIALAHAGAEAYHAGCIGGDGAWLKQTLEAAGADVSHIGLVDEATGHAIIQVNDAGENAIVLHGGANRAITVELASKALGQFGAGDIVLLQNETNAVPEIMKLAAARKMIVAFNAAPMSTGLAKYPLGLVGIFIINETEGESLTGEEAPGAILDAMRSRFPSAAIILTLGVEGAMYADANQRMSCAAEKVEPVDTTAAGDTFTGYFLAEIALGRDPESALQIASKAASICVTRAGAGISIPRRGDLAT